MTAPTNRVLIVGAGVAGCAAGILLAEAGWHVEMIEHKSSVTTSGSGITLQGNALRVFRELGVLDEIIQHGYSFDTLGFRTPDGDLVHAFPDFKTGGDDLPATVGLPRTELARILVGRARCAGVNLRFDTTVTALQGDDEGVDAATSDGITERYGLVIGADGVNSIVRSMIGIDTRPQPLGMGIFRIFCGRPSSVERTDLVYGGTCYIAGYCPTADDSMYAYLIEDAQNRSSSSPDDLLTVVRELASTYHGPWDEIRDLLVDGDQINYTWFEAHLIEGAWNRGRIVLIGDAAHSCPPTLAQGAAQALEDASVLCELLIARGDADADVFDAFHERRVERARLIVESSVQLCNWLLAHDTDADLPGVFARTAAVLSVPA